MRDYLNIGSSPCAEKCVQVGEPNYAVESRKECNRFIELIRKCLGEEPDGATLAIKSFPHDFGTYHEVVCYYDDTNEVAIDYAFKCESEAPETLDAKPYKGSKTPLADMIKAQEETEARGKSLNQQ